jgi:hypothetical protein
MEEEGRGFRVRCKRLPAFHWIRRRNRIDEVPEEDEENDNIEGDYEDDSKNEMIKKAQRKKISLSIPVCLSCTWTVTNVPRNTFPLEEEAT